MYLDFLKEELIFHAEIKVLVFPKQNFYSSASTKPSQNTHSSVTPSTWTSPVTCAPSPSLSSLQSQQGFGPMVVFLCNLTCVR